MGLAMDNRRFVLSEGESLVEASRSLSIEEQRVLALILSLPMAKACALISVFTSSVLG